MDLSKFIALFAFLGLVSLVICWLDESGRKSFGRLAVYCHPHELKQFKSMLVIPLRMKILKR